MSSIQPYISLLTTRRIACLQYRRQTALILCKQRSSSSTEACAAAVTKINFSTLATLATPARCPTRHKIHSRAGNIAGHLQPPSSPPYTTMAESYHSGAPSPYTVRKIGAANTLEHRIFIEENGKPLSPFHDIPLYANADQTVLNMVVEVPRWTNAKMEVRELRLFPLRSSNSLPKLPLHGSVIGAYS
jgi:inorganic pyrophosphatase